MPPKGRKKTLSDVIPKAHNSRASKSVKHNSTLLSEKAITLTLAEAKAEEIDPDIIATDSEDGPSDTDIGEDPFSPPSPIRSSLSNPSLAAVQSTPAETKSPSTETRSQNLLSPTLKNGLAQSIHAKSSEGFKHRTQNLKRLPSKIAADLKAVVTRCAARVIAGLPILDELSTASKCKKLSNANSYIMMDEHTEYMENPSNKNKNLG
ncbi:putative effector protein [Erysiphe necator]|uniref:Putative effector protein n=1 Tax=Uncinula necator TaxID=52586 RepID=A0A0B1P033_UNCNE|nr:putative effector protein [Erysiphe necator]